MIYESSYDSGRKPFLPETERVYWAKPSNFLFACWGLALRMDVFLISWLSYATGNVFGLIPLLILMVLISVPIVFIQSFLGQFSSSGFISVLRIAPLFKGIGYCSLIVNIFVMGYYGVLIAVPLLLVFYSMRTVLPWSCEALLYGQHNLTDIEQLRICNVSNTTNEMDYLDDHQLPSMIFLRNHFAGQDMDMLEESSLSISLELVGCILLAWLVITLIFFKCFHTEKFGKLVRYLLCTIMTLLLICMTRFLLYPGILKRFIKYLVIPNWWKLLSNLTMTPMLVIYLLGPGFGAIISFASNNKFKTNITRYSWLICLGQFLVFATFDFMSLLIQMFFKELETTQKLRVFHNWTLINSAASALASLPWPQLWTILFFSMMTLSALTVILLQMHSIYTSIFDEFVFLRAHKSAVIFGFISFWIFTSVITCANLYTMDFELLILNSLVLSITMLFSVLLIVLWSYGRERFQRDLQFMLGQPFATWRINVLRIISVVAFIFLMLMLAAFAIFETFTYLSMFVLTLLSILAYAIFFLIQTTGPISMRFKRCCRPIDWYPLELEHRRKYEEALSNMEITQQLEEVGEEVVL